MILLRVLTNTQNQLKLRKRGENFVVPFFSAFFLTSATFVYILINPKKVYTYQ